ncbi:histidine kinase N-terminal 7TM domain-containing diguanylate cyclase [Acidicapsa acidisoli]|uniref:histidine kinase N-terminal 7TM domain-containing diguanylate cyclase n=1 Tax=Acidicapsa acidisoli TaxID=1615681 RepID=UPI0021DFD7C7|nr:diguanylate cyclase [Acidicapsa acidisoli]
MGIDVVVLARFLLTGIALLLAFLATITWSRRKDAPEATAFAILVASMAVYAFGYAGEIAQTTTTAARRWLDVEYLALPWAGGLWVLAACKHNGRRGRTPLLFVIPAITFVGHYTNYKNLFYTAPMTMVQRGPFRVLMVERGPLSVLDNAYLMVAFLVGAWIYLSGLRNASLLFQKQAMILVTASFLPFVGYFVYLTGLSPWGLDVTPVTLGLTCALIYYGIFHCGIFDLAPLARNLIFNSMRDAVLILDTHDRLLDFNPAAHAMFPILNKRNLGTDVVSMLSDTSTFVEAVRSTEDEVEITMEGSDPLSYEVRKWPLFTASSNSASRLIGRAVIFADVTAQVRLREELRGRAETDPLTGVANRRRFYQALEIECLRFTRNQLPLSVLMIDLDFFKDVNDEYGHPVGDAVLRIVAQLLLLSLRKTDLLARYGGEEFSVLLPETRMEGAQVIAERIRQTVCEQPVLADGCHVHVSVSVGIASHDNDGEAAPEILLKKADLALYRAKALGRNRVEVA